MIPTLTAEIESVIGGHMLPVTQIEQSLQFVETVAGKATGLAS